MGASGLDAWRGWAASLLLGCATAAAAGAPATPPQIVSLDTLEVLEGVAPPREGLQEAVEHLLAVQLVFDALQQGQLQAATLLQTGDALRPPRRTVEQALRAWLHDQDGGALPLLAAQLAGSTAAFAERQRALARQQGAEGAADTRVLARLARHVLERHPDASLLFAQHGGTLQLTGSGARLQVLVHWPQSGSDDPALLVASSGPGLAALESARGRYRRLQLADARQMLLQPRVLGSVESRVPVGAASALYLTLGRTDDSRPTQLVRLRTPLLAPLADGANVGELEVSVAGRAPLSVPLVTLAETHSAGRWANWRDRLAWWLTW
ncbi:MAG: Penicillin-binding protein 5, C-terminal domain [Pseudomonadota bacterium]|jgi:hypothetical protein